ncbi:hypothetical protein ENUP19_0050G0060 [Entamoeba nuttalli]|uniref:Peptidase M24 domain-containing protein n=1 Tax=Entamoeba nuttalli TaxID=412467 RepID=A0ABQ0DBP7_9EUKA
MSTIHKPKKSAVSIEKKIATQQKKEQLKQENEIKKEEENKEEEELESAGDPRVVKHYEEAAEITNAAMKLAESLCVDGAIVYEVCKKVNEFIDEEAAKVFKNEYSYEKGIAFPCCISLNNCCGYFCPLAEDKTSMKKGDLAKIELATHISGFVAEACKTIVIGEEATGDKATIIEAGYTALQEVISKLQVGVNTSDITTVVDGVCKKYNVKAFENIVSRNMERYMIDGNKFILNVPSKSAVEDMKIELNDVWNLDIILTTGAAKPVEKETRTTVYKRNIDETYILKMRTSVQIFREVNNKYPTFPFSLGMLENESKAKMGIVEMAKHDLVDSYTVVYEKTGLVSQFKATIIVTENGPKVLTPIEAPAFIKKN